MIRLVNLYPAGHVLPGAAEFLYDLMKEREPEVNISHKGIPTWDEHVAFVRSRPYRAWYLIETDAGVGAKTTTIWAGYVSLTHNNEVGVVISKIFRGRGYGPKSIRLLLDLHKPNPSVPSVRNGAWLANINPQNEHSKHVFEKLGFRKIQETYCLEEEHHAKTEESTSA